MIKSIYRCSIVTFLLFILICGFYPVFVTFMGQLLFSEQSNGGLVYQNSQPVGAKLIGQDFSSQKYFHGRPSAAGEKGYDGLSSSPSNLASTNKTLIENMRKSISKILLENPTIKREDIPVDLVTSSGSGLDPDISLESALLQVARVAKSRKMSEDNLKTLIYSLLEKPILGFIGTEKINILLLNLQLDKEIIAVKK